MKTKVWLNSKLIDIDKAKISIFDRGFLYGDGVFETMRSYAGIVFKLDAHMSRLFKSLKALGIRPPYSKKYLEAVIAKLLKVNNLKSAYIRLAVTRGEGRFGISYKDKFSPNVVIVAKEFEGYPDWMIRQGLRTKAAGIRVNEYSPLSRIKSLNFLNYILARYEAKHDRFDEAILLNTKGYVAEGATSNIFLVKRKALITPSLETGVLPGVTRKVIIDIAKALKIKVKEKLVSRRELLNADELFLTNSLAEVLPVVSIDSKRIGRGSPGSVTKLLHISYQKRVIREVIFT